MTDENASTTEAIRLKGFRIRDIFAVEFVEVEIAEGETLIIGGDNSQGKTSILRAIWMALGGKKAIYDDAIRHGCSKGSVVLDVGDYTIGLLLDSCKGPRFEVRGADGKPVRAPMALLNKWKGMIGYDPLEFARLGETPEGRRKQSEILMHQAGLDFSEIDAKAKEVYESRTSVGQDVKVHAGALATMPFDEDAPKEVTLVTDLLAEREVIVGQQRKRAAAVTEKDAMIGNVTIIEGRVAANATEIEELQKRIKGLKEMNKANNKKADELSKKADAIEIPDEITTTEIDERIANAEETNNTVRSNLAYLATKAHLDDAKKEYQGFSDILASLQAEKADMLANAKFPLEGLGVRGDDNEVVYNGTIFANLSSSEQYRVSTEQALATAGDLKLAISDNLESLDPKTLKMVKDLISARGANLVAARVSTGEECTFIMQEGRAVEPERKGESNA